MTSAGVLGQAVEEQVDVVLPMVVEACEGVVHHGKRPRSPRGRADPLDVRDLVDRVGRALEQDQPRRPPGEDALDAFVVLDRQQRVLDPELRQQLPDQVAARAV
jgi:hypothetical protein